MYGIRLNDGEVITEKDPVELFLSDIDIKPNSREIYRRQIRQYIEYLNQREILKPDKETIQGYKQYLIDSGKASGTVSSYLGAIKALYKWMERNRIGEDITYGVKLPRRAVGFKKDSLTPGQAGELLRSFDLKTEQGIRDYAIVNILIRTGVRTIEIYRANVKDIQQIGEKCVLFIQGKGCDSKDEYVVLTEETLNPIRNYLAKRSDVKANSPLFTSFSDRNTGKRLCTRSISRICKEAFRKIGLNSTRISAHSLRHSAVTFALLAGSSLEQVQMMARHRDINITRIYGHNIDRLKDAPEYRIDLILSGNLQKN